MEERLTQLEGHLKVKDGVIAQLMEQNKTLMEVIILLYCVCL
jgi:hypothetical protein